MSTTYELHLAAGRKMADQLHRARTLQELDALYVEWVGYSIVADDPEITLEILADLLEEYLNEVLASTGVAWIDAHAEPEQAA